MMQDITQVPTTVNSSKRRQILRSVKVYFGISTLDIWNCKTLEDFRHLLKTSYHEEALKFHPDRIRHNTMHTQ